MNARQAAILTEIGRKVAAADTYRGWTISPPDIGPFWTATGPDYDASYEGPEDGWVDNGQKVEARTYKDLLVEIEGFIADLDIIARQRAHQAEQRRTGSLRKAIPGFYWITFLQLATCVAVAAFVVGAAVTWGAGG